MEVGGLIFHRGAVSQIRARGGGEKLFDSRKNLSEANFEKLKRHAVMWRIFSGFMENESFIKFDSFG